jgi:hypothetical protein
MEFFSIFQCLIILPQPLFSCQLVKFLRLVCSLSPFLQGRVTEENFDEKGKVNAGYILFYGPGNYR